MNSPSESNNQYDIGVSGFMRGVSKHGYPGHLGFTIGSSANKLAAEELPAESSKQTPTQANTEQKRIDEDASLKLVPFDALDRNQSYANAGDTMPVVFCRRVNNQGGIWISPPLLEVVSNDFVPTFVYLVTHGQTLLTNIDFLGNRAMADIIPGGSIIKVQGYTNDPTVCPLSFGASCDHSIFKFLADPLSASVGSIVRIRTINRYTTGITIKAKPLYPDGVTPPTALEQYTLTVQRIDNATATVTTIGTFVTSSDSSITSITDTPTAGNYTYSIINSAVNTAATDKPETILLEFIQSNTFPTSYDRTSSYTDITLKIIKGNLYDVEKAYSPPSGLKQLHIFMEDGVYVQKWRWSNPGNPEGSTPPFSYTSIIASSDIFADLIHYWFVNSGKYLNQNVQHFFISDIAETAIFHENYDLKFNGIVSASSSFISWAQTIAPFFLCSFSYTYMYRLLPLLPLDANRQIHLGDLRPVVKEAFNDIDLDPDSLANGIIAGSYRKTYLDTQQRVPFQVVVTWRGQDSFSLETSQTTTVRYSDYASTAPEEPFDMSSFCTNANHATLFAKYVLASRRYSQHTVSFQTGRNVETTSELQPLDLISVSLSRVNSEGDSRVETEYYLVDSLEYDQTGIVTITATQFPLTAAGIGVINDSILNGSFVVTT